MNESDPQELKYRSSLVTRMQVGDFQDFNHFNRIVLRVWYDGNILCSAYLYDTGRIEVLRYDCCTKEVRFTTNKIII